MKIFFCFIVLFFLSAAPASGLDLNLERPSLKIASSHAPSREQERVAATATLAMMALADFSQSVRIFSQGGVELNPILGKKPNNSQMLLFGVTAIAVTYLAAKWLPEPWNRILLDSALISEGWNLEENNRVLDGRARKINGIPIILTIRLD